MKTKLIPFALFAAATAGALLLAGCTQVGAAPSGAASNQTSSDAAPHKIIIDCDGGADDAAAIVALAQGKNIDLLGVTCVEGNANLQRVGASALMDLEIAGRPDVSVFLGCDLPNHEQQQGAVSVYGSDGMGDCGLIHPSGSVQEQSAIDFIIQTVRENPDEVELVILGPATNLAAAIEQDPETMAHVKHYWIMGTAGLGVGNATPVAEFNVYSDPSAFATLLGTATAKTIVPFDVSVDAITFSEDQFGKTAKASEKSTYVYNAFGKLFDYSEQHDGTRQATLCDFAAAACLLDSNVIAESVNCHAVCVTDEGVALGQVVFFQEGIEYETHPDVGAYNVQLVLAEDSPKVKQLLLDALA